jgi:hypothetical protein
MVRTNVLGNSQNACPASPYYDTLVNTILILPHLSAELFSDNAVDKDDEDEDEDMLSVSATGEQVSNL